ncbi:MAG TPA: hypothetical protein VNB52_12125, partial [Ilumatobacteraceae bacterium]|nr:hypothetical protein [Ilumatobacteraceae bacterium]
GALVLLNTYSFGATVPSVSVNGNPFIVTPLPPQFSTFGWETMAIPVPLEQVHDGTNTLTFTSGDGSTTIANISIILVAGAAVP